MPNLSREEAAARSALIKVDSYDVDLDLDQGTEVFGSSTTIRFRCLTPGASTFFEVVPRQLGRVTLNGRELPVTDATGDGRFPLTDLAAENVLTVTATMEYSHSGEGLHRFSDPEDGLDYVYMMAFLDMASRVYACFEQPDIKAPFRLTVTAPQSWQVIANEAGTQVSPGRWEFDRTQPLATYFMTLVAGPYHSIYRSHEGVRFGLHARQTYREALENDAEELFDVTFGCWDRLHELYGVPYAFGDTYDQCFVPEFNAGAMENPGCVTFRDEAFMYRSAVTDARRESRATTIAHEMAHMWFGDLVTMSWWDDLWLNESFADCMGVRAATEGTRFTGVHASEAIIALRGYAADERSSTHPVAGDVVASDEALNNFDGISYEKGGAVLNQLAAWLGDEAFFDGLRKYFERFRFGNAKLADLMDCLAEASGRDLTDWSQRWLRTTGPNTLRVESSIEDGVYTAATIVQTGEPFRPHRLRLGLYRVDGDETVRFHQVTVDIDGERTEVPDLVGQPVADLLMVNDDDLTYAKIRLDEPSFAAVAGAMPTLSNPLTRALLWNLLVDMVGDADLSVDEYLDILAAVLPSEPSVAAVGLQLRHAKGFVDTYLSPEARPDGVRRLHEIASIMRRGAVAGDGIQLSALRYEVATASSPDEIAWVAGLLADENVPEGITMDAELRWDCLLRLVVLGAAGESDIDAELERDASSEGHKHAATCRAALPTPEAKAAAWQSVQWGEGLSNHVLRATADGFWWPEQEALTADYVAGFFADSPDGIGKRMPWEARHLGQVLFPSHAATAATIEAAETMLAADLNPHLRRSVSDALDDMRRAFRARG
ncbi:aminopeptidase N [Stackebrandtia endophytica]|uniref:Aminopeptidase N n=1 Tax=Stackebrandtia endophytica TaxID=1496996 RepID=A0A543B0K7_9ACTN|nr:aminopeptidase N [Stackebrandtia endophytica]TQL78371.1 aminopeptidase N [Stackebrandtia endophytica]